MVDNHNFVQHVDTAQQFQPDVPSRIEADTSPQVDIGLEMAQRAKYPEQRPPETQLPVQPQKSTPPLIVSF
jgi:hypothetical protein